MIRTLSPLSGRATRSLDHANKNHAVFVVFFTVVDEVDREWIIEGFTGLLEAHTVLGVIGSSLCRVPFEIACIHDITDYP
jgi:hypothetical protein